MEKWKKTVSLLLAALLVSAIVPCSALALGSLPFRDVPRDAWYSQTVKAAWERGIVKGTSETTFEPEGVVTREAFLVMLYRAAGIQTDAFHSMFYHLKADAAAIYFSDVEWSAWYAETVCLAKEMGVTNGIGDGRFGVGEPVTREQMATLADRLMAMRLHVALKQTGTPALAFSDTASISDWARDAVEAMRRAGILRGDERQRVRPQGLATRAEAAAVVLRLADATERVSFVPAGTAWIRLRNQQTLINGEPRCADIRDPLAVQSMIHQLDTMPVSEEYGLPQTSGWVYWISFYDANDQYLGGYQFDSQFVDVGSSRLITPTQYFHAWTKLV